MNLKLYLRWLPVVGLGAALLAPLSSARANVYATNIKLNNGTTNVSCAPGDTVSISYILNEPATLGVTVNILSGSSVVRTINLPADAPGALVGLNTVSWDLQDNASNNVPAGNYNLSITAAASGFTTWTNTTSDGNIGNVIYDGHGIAVDCNAASPYYGRVFVANSTPGDAPETYPGHNVGVVKLNADGSAADEGAFSTGGLTWTGQQVPWKVEFSRDDLLYLNDHYPDDLIHPGKVYRWDATLSTNALLPVLGTNNQTAGSRLNGMAIVGSGTNSQLFMADNLSTLGVLNWALLTGTCASNDTGTTVISLGNDPTNNLTMGPEDVAVDSQGHLYVCQSVTNAADPAARVFRFPAWTNGSQAELTADWAVGSGDDNYGGASGIAVDPTGTYVAVAFQGVVVGGLSVNGNTKVLYATNGSLVANLDLDRSISGYSTHWDTDCAWDAVGNVYCIDNYYGTWRAFSPPGTNQATTVSLASIQVGAPPPVVITNITFDGTNVTLIFTALPNEQPTGFIVLSGSSAWGPFSPVTAAQITLLSPGVFRAVFPSPGTPRYFNIERRSATPQAPQLTGIRLNAGSVTLSFTGSPNDLPSAFTVLSAPSISGPFADAGPFPVLQSSPGVFEATGPANGPARFYRIQR